MLCDLDVILHLWIVLSFRISMSNRRNKVNNNHYHSMQNTIRYCLFFFSASKTVQLHCNCYLSWHKLAVLFSFRHPVHVNCSHDRYIEIWIRIWIWLCNRKISEWEKKPTSCIIYILIYLLCIWILQKCSIIVEILLLLASLSRVSFAVCIWPGIALLRSGSGLEITDRPTDWHRLMKHTFF